MPSPLKIHALGFRGAGDQISRIEDGFRELGHEVTPHVSEADLVFANDSGFYAQAIEDKARGVIRGKVIFNVLDLAPHLGAQFPLARVRDQLTHADAVTCISAFVQQDLAARADIKATVIYNPIQRIAGPRRKVFPYRAMFVGRVNDPFKRAGLAAAALAILGFQYDEVVTVGREPPYYGFDYYGVASEAVMNDLYHSVDYVMFPSGANEGMGMPPLEAAAAGAIPALCRDLCTREEFFPAAVFPEYEEVTPDVLALAEFIARFTQNDEARAEFSARLQRHYEANWATRLSPRGVAEAIVGVYETL